jgi:hypothetical protein
MSGFSISGGDLGDEAQKKLSFDTTASYMAVSQKIQTELYTVPQFYSDGCGHILGAREMPYGGTVQHSTVRPG